MSTLRTRASDGRPLRSAHRGKSEAWGTESTPPITDGLRPRDYAPPLPLAWPCAQQSLRTQHQDAPISISAGTVRLFPIGLSLQNSRSALPSRPRAAQTRTIYN